MRLPEPLFEVMTQAAPTLQTDATLKGLGAVLLQEGHLIYFASKSPTTSEGLCCDYSHLQLEMDQRNLEYVFTKSLTQATARL